MTDFIFAGIILTMLVGFGWYVRETNIERKKLLNAILSKTPQDMVNMTLADQTQIKPEVNPPSDLMPESELSDEDFDKSIQKQLDG